MIRSFVCSTEPRASPSRRAIGADLALAVAAALASFIVLLVSTRHQVQGLPRLLIINNRYLVVGAPGTGPAPGIPLGGLLTIAGTTLPLAARRLRPLTAFWVTILAAILGSSYMTAIIFLVVIFSAYSAVLYSRFRGVALLSVPAAGVVATAVLPDTTPPLPGRFAALLILVLIAIVGNATRLWRRRAGDSQARIVSMQAEHEAATRRALEQERARIAGELHDVVTHNVSVMIVQAGAARQVLTDSPDAAKAALLAVESSGRAAMTELRHLLGLLSPAQAPAGQARPDTGDLRPQPGLGQLQPLIDRVCAAGLPVELHVAGEPRGLPPGQDLAAFRVVQEALTNVIKHAGKPQTTVTLDYRADDLVVEVADAGRPVPAAGPTASGAGRGLLGLRERMTLYGGDLLAEAQPGGGWLVRARMPVDPLMPAGQS
jgi:signal transduction histidine kinase